MDKIVLLERPAPRGPVAHEGAAHLTLTQDGVVVPAILEYVREAHGLLVTPHSLTKVSGSHRFDAGALLRRAAFEVGSALQPVLNLAGLRIVDREGLELLEHLLKGRGLVLGASALGNYAEDQIMKHIFRNTAIFTPPANVYVGLWTATTGEANDSGTEVSGGSYARQAVGTTSGWTAPSDGALDNAADTDFGTASGSWGTITHVDLSSAVSGTANRYFHGALASSKTVASGDSFKFALGALDVAVA